MGILEMDHSTRASERCTIWNWTGLDIDMVVGKRMIMSRNMNVERNMNMDMNMKMDLSQEYEHDYEHPHVLDMTFT